MQVDSSSILITEPSESSGLKPVGLGTEYGSLYSQTEVFAPETFHMQQKSKEGVGSDQMQMSEAGVEAVISITVTGETSVNFKGRIIQKRGLTDSVSDNLTVPIHCQ